jgi:hypothetical protein
MQRAMFVFDTCLRACPDSQHWVLSAEVADHSPSATAQVKNVLSDTYTACCGASVHEDRDKLTFSSVTIFTFDKQVND